MIDPGCNEFLILHLQTRAGLDDEEGLWRLYYYQAMETRSASGSWFIDFEPVHRARRLMCKQGKASNVFNWK